MIWLNTAKQKVRQRSPAGKKEEISMPEALENQHRCGYTSPSTMALYSQVLECSPSR